MTEEAGTEAEAEADTEQSDRCEGVHIPLMVPTLLKLLTELKLYSLGDVIALHSKLLEWALSSS